MKYAVALVAAVIVAWLIYSQVNSTPAEFDWQLPADIPNPPVPAENPMTDVKVKLGRWLFYDTRLSGNKTMSCASCHQQSLAFTDGEAQSIGSTGEVHPRSAMTLVNTAYASRLNWANPLQDRLEYQALTPLLGDKPVEMGMSSRNSDVGGLLEADYQYRDLARAAFPNDKNPYSTLNTVRSIASFVRSIVSFDSPYDHYLAGNADALTPAAERGMELFFSERLECFHCHGGFNFTDSTTHANSEISQVGFHNNGLYNLKETGAYPNDNTGLYDMTGQARDMGRFKAPSLRNIGLTAPYMHDGSIGSLAEVIEHYERGGRLIESGPYVGDGRLSPFRSEFVSGFELSDSEAQDLLEFLKSLTDESVLNDERWSDPNRE